MNDSNLPPTSTNPPAGFYPDSQGASRWWDGNDWTDHVQSVAQAAPIAEAPRAKKKRVFLWVFMVVQVLFIIWIVAGISGGSGTPDDCGSLDAELCNDASDVGTGIGVFLVFVFWVIVDFLLAVTYGIYRLAKRN